MALAVFGTLATSKTTSLTALGSSRASALVGGYHVTFLIGALFAAVGLLVTVVLLWAPAKEVVEAQLSESDAIDMEELEIFAHEF
jgi:uncharacterized membrane protein